MLLRSIGFGELSALLRRLGQPSAARLLRPHCGVGRSLSGHHGLGAYPFHTDGATQQRPPAYVAIWSPRSSPTATVLVDGMSPQLALPPFERAWLVTPGPASRSFYAVPRLRRCERVEWRWNPDCMRPTMSRLSAVDFDSVFASIEQIRIAWRACDALVINNHRMLHSREAVVPNDSTRALLRIQVHDDMVS